MPKKVTHNPQKREGDWEAWKLSQRANLGLAEIPLMESIEAVS